MIPFDQVAEVAPMRARWLPALPDSIRPAAGSNPKPLRGGETSVPDGAIAAGSNLSLTPDPLTLTHANVAGMERGCWTRLDQFSHYFA